MRKKIDIDQYILYSNVRINLVKGRIIETNKSGSSLKIVHNFLRQKKKKNP